MAVSRRTFLAASAAAPILSGLPGVARAEAVAPSASPPGDVVGKITVGY
ncbi:hypothetical protein ACIP39_05385 [Streptomyces tibetensis]